MTYLTQLVRRVEELAKAVGDALQLRGFKAGGTTGQVPVKSSGNDFDWSWGDVAGGSGGVTVQDESVSLATIGTTLNFVGAGVTASGTGSVKTITIPAAGVPTAITAANEASDTSCFPVFFTGATGDLGPKTNAGLTFNATTGNLGAATFNGLTLTAALAGFTIAGGTTPYTLTVGQNASVSGTNTGDQDLSGYSLVGHTHAEEQITFTDITTGNASASAHGYLPKLENSGSKYLRDDGTWQAVPGGSGTPGGADGDIQINVSGAFGAVTGKLIANTTTGAITHLYPSLGTTSLSSITVENATGAADGAQQVSPSISWRGRGRKTNPTAASQPVEFRANVLPVQAASAPTAMWRLQSQINDTGGFADQLTVTTTGALTASGAIQGSALNTSGAVASGGSGSIAAGQATASGSRSIAVGNGNTASADSAACISGTNGSASAVRAATIGGAFTLADRINMVAHGGTTAHRQWQHSNIFVRRETTNATPAQLTIDGAAETGTTITTSNRVIIAANTIVDAMIYVTGVRKKTEGNDYCSYIRRAVITRDNSNNTTISTVATIGTDIETNAGYDVAVTADDTNEALVVTVTGVAAHSMRWFARIEANELTYA